MFDLSGRVVGVSTAVIMPQKQTNGIGFALPITNELLAKVNDLKAGLEINYAYLGVMVSTPTTAMRRDCGVTDNSGVAVDSVEKDSPAAARLFPGDIVLKINDRVVADSDQFVRAIGAAPIAQPATFTVQRDGHPLTLSIQLRRRELPSVAVNRMNQRFRWQGMLLGPIPANWDTAGQGKRPEHGLIILNVDPNSPVVKQGVRVGSILTKVAGTQIDTVTQLQTVINDTPAQQCRIELLPSMKDAVVSGQ